MNRSVQPSIRLHECVRRWRTQSYSFDVVTKHVEARSFHTPFIWDIIVPFSLTLRIYEDHSKSFERLVQVVNTTRLREIKCGNI